MAERLKMARHDWNGWKWLNLAGVAKIGWKWLEMAINGWKWLDMTGYGWTS